MNKLVMIDQKNRRTRPAIVQVITAIMDITILANMVRKLK